LPAYTGLNPPSARRISARSPEKIRHLAGGGSHQQHRGPKAQDGIYGLCQRRASALLDYLKVLIRKVVKVAVGEVETDALTALWINATFQQWMILCICSDKALDIRSGEVADFHRADGKVDPVYALPDPLIQSIAEL